MAPGLAARPRLGALRPEPLDAAELARLEAAFGAFFASRTMRELYEGALARRILLAPCNDAREMLAQPQLRERELFTTLEYPELGAAIEHPDFFAKIEPRRDRRPAPRAAHRRAQRRGLRRGRRRREALAKLAAEGAL